MRRLFIFIALMPLLTFGQPSSALEFKDSSIRFVQFGSWKRIREIAKATDKHIFLDIFATWCGPCKEMERKVFTDRSVAKYFNEKFISVRVQLDRTSLDSKYVKDWYKDAMEIQKEYRVKAFPTFIFLSPDGLLLQKDVGYKSATELLDIATKASHTKSLYQDPEEELYHFIQKFEQGVREYDKMIVMRQRALDIGEVALAQKISKTYKDYLIDRGHREIFKQRNLEYLSTTFIPSSSPLFKVFYSDARKVDRILKNKGVAGAVVESTILLEIVAPYFQKYQYTMGGNMMGGELDTAQANWQELEELIARRFNKNASDRSVLYAKIDWYDNHSNLREFNTNYFEYLDKYGINSIDKFSKAHVGMVNSYCWRVFNFENDSRILRYAIKWMRKVIASNHDKYNWVDTFANLLYKAGYVKRAIYWEQVALSHAKAASNDMRHEEIVKEYTDNLSKMKLGKPTWIIDMK